MIIPRASSEATGWAAANSLSHLRNEKWRVLQTPKNGEAELQEGHSGSLRQQDSLASVLLHPADQRVPPCFALTISARKPAGPVTLLLRWRSLPIDTASSRTSPSHSLHRSFRPRSSPSKTVVDCDKVDAGCGGGYLDNVWNYVQVRLFSPCETLQSFGVVTEACLPYKSADNKCPLPGNCSDGSNPTYYFAKKGYAIFPDEKDIQVEIMTNGPIEGSDC